MQTVITNVKIYVLALIIILNLANSYDVGFEYEFGAFTVLTERVVSKDVMCTYDGPGGKYQFTVDQVMGLPYLEAISPPVNSDQAQESSNFIKNKVSEWYQTIIAQNKKTINFETYQEIEKEFYLIGDIKCKRNKVSTSNLKPNPSSFNPDIENTWKIGIKVPTYKQIKINGNKITPNKQCTIGITIDDYITKVPEIRFRNSEQDLNQCKSQMDGCATKLCKSLVTFFNIMKTTADRENIIGDNVGYKGGSNLLLKSNVWSIFRLMISGNDVSSNAVILTQNNDGPYFLNIVNSYLNQIKNSLRDLKLQNKWVEDYQPSKDNNKNNIFKKYVILVNNVDTIERWIADLGDGNVIENSVQRAITTFPFPNRGSYNYIVELRNGCENVQYKELLNIMGINLKY